MMDGTVEENARHSGVLEIICGGITLYGQPCVF